MKKFDRVYLSRFELDPDPERFWLEDFDSVEGLEYISVNDEIFFENEDDFINSGNTVNWETYLNKSIQKGN